MPLDVETGQRLRFVCTFDPASGPIRRMAEARRSRRDALGTEVRGEDAKVDDKVLLGLDDRLVAAATWSARRYAGHATAVRQKFGLAARLPALAADRRAGRRRAELDARGMDDGPGGDWDGSGWNLGASVATTAATTSPWLRADGRAGAVRARRGNLRLAAEIRQLMNLSPGELSACLRSAVARAGGADRRGRLVLGRAGRLVAGAHHIVAAADEPTPLQGRCLGGRRRSLNGQLRRCPGAAHGRAGCRPASEHGRAADRAPSGARRAVTVRVWRR